MLVGADFAGDHQRRRHLDAVDASEVQAAHLEQPGAQVELRRIARLAALLALVGLHVGDVQLLQMGLDFLATLRKLVAAEVERSQRQAQCEQPPRVPGGVSRKMLKVGKYAHAVPARGARP